MPLTGEGALQIRFTPDPLGADAGVVAAASATETVEVGWGIGFDLSALPSVCYTNQPCTGEVRLSRRGTGAERILGDAAGRLVHEEDGAAVSAVPFVADDVYALQRTYPTPRTVSWTVLARSDAGEARSPAHAVEVREPLVLAAPSAVDFGARGAGEATAESCRALDLSASSRAGRSHAPAGRARRWGTA